MAYEPSKAIYPGMSLQEHLEYVGMTQKEFAERVGMDKKTINQIIKGKAPITCETAIRFERVTGIPAHIWNNLEKLYQEDCVRLGINLELEQQLPFLDNFSCIKDLVGLGIIPLKDKKNKIELLESIFSLLQIDSPQSFQLAYSPTLRISTKHEISEHNLICWEKAGEVLSKNISVKEFDKKNIKSIIQELKELTKNQETIEFDKIQEIFANIGIRFVVVPHFHKTPVSGLAKLFLNQPIIQISTRGKKLDIIRFNIFHELGHIYNNDIKNQTVFDFDNYKASDEEKNANNFASNILINEQEYVNLIKHTTLTEQMIQDFADKQNIGVNIVAGRICHDFYEKNPKLFQQASKFRPSLS